MSNATAKNEIQAILREYLGNKKVPKVAETVYAAMQTETHHTHNGKDFFINEDFRGALVLTMESMIKEHVQKVLLQYLEEDEIPECLEQLMEAIISTEEDMTAEELETIVSQKADKNKIQAVLQEYMGNQKAVEVAEAVYTVVQAETHHTHNGKKFFINEDSRGALVLTVKSMIKENVKKILPGYLEEDKILECFEQLMAGINPTKKEMKAEIETISIEGSDSQIYLELLKHIPTKESESIFLSRLKRSVEAGVKPFKVPVYDPSIDEDGYLQFVYGEKPAVGYSYEDLEILALVSGYDIHLGTRNQWILFLATMIHRFIEEGWSEKDAFYSVCTNSAKLGNYSDSPNAKGELETTGLRKFAGKCDLANAAKILKDDESYDGEKYHTTGGGSYRENGSRFPLAYLYYTSSGSDTVGWFVL